MTQPAATILYKDAFSQFLDHSESVKRTFVTLGPEGTSSKQASDYLARLYDAHVALFDTYEEASRAVAKDPANTALVVANAYSGINTFYISHDLFPSSAFFFDTPEYIVAARPGADLGKSGIRIATHPAPKHLIASTLDRTDVSVLEVNSTHQAAEMTARGDVEVCLTTRIAAELLGLETVAQAITTIPMLWTIFTSKDPNI